MSTVPVTQNIGTENVEPEKAQLSQSVKNSLISLLRKFGTREMYPRLCEIADAQSQRFYARGYQHLYWDAGGKSFSVSGAGSGVTLPFYSSAADEPSFMYSFNMYQMYMKSFIATMIQNVPTTREKPDNVMEPMDISAAHGAEQMKKLIEERENSKNLRADIARLTFTDRRVLTLTEWNQKEQKTITRSFGVLESKVPIASKSEKSWPYCFLYIDRETCEVKEEYPNQAKDIQQGMTGAPNEQVARTMRMSVAEGTPIYTMTGDSLAYMGTEAHCFFRPSAYRELSDEDADEMRGLYPEGVKAIIFGDVVLGEPEAVNMDDRVGVMKSLPGEGFSTTSIGASIMPLQDIFNDEMNMSAECFAFTIPTTWLRDQIIDVNALQTQRAAYGNHQVVDQAKEGMPLADNFYTEPSITPPDAMFKFMEMIQGSLAQGFTGQQPALFGGKMEGAGGETAAGYEQARAQAMGVMGLSWLPFTVLWAKITQQSIMCMIENSPDNGTFTGQLPGKNGADPQTIVVSVDDMRGKFKCYPETDMDFPESHAQKQGRYDALVQLANTNPFAQALLTMPDNLPVMKEMIGLEDLVIKGEDSRNKALKEIKMLSEVTPVPDEQVMQTQSGIQPPVDEMGIPLPPPPILKSSIPVDPYADFLVEAMEYQRYLNSPEGQQLKEENPQGFMNVVLHWQELVKAMQPPPLPPGALPPQGVQPNA